MCMVERHGAVGLKRLRVACTFRLAAEEETGALIFRTSFLIASCVNRWRIARALVSSLSF